MRRREFGVLGPPTPVERGGNFVRYHQGVRVHFNWPYQWLDRGNSWEFGNARLTLEPDGNLVLRNRHNGSVHRTTDTPNSEATQMLFQIDDNLVLYTVGYTHAPWASNTAWRCGDNLALLGLQDDSNMVMYCSRSATGGVEVTPYWHTNTDGI